jgi:hydroxymethylpyrimidine pyrophosphatase-like HAD family hydrolase
MDISVYLDIDGTILNKKGIPAYKANDFIKCCVDNFDTYWLTTHCKGDAVVTFQHIKKHFPEEIHSYLKKIKGTNWGALKTDALDFSKEFVWFDDYLVQSELKLLEENNAENKHIMINLEENPYQLEEMIEYLNQIITNAKQ